MKKALMYAHVAYMIQQFNMENIRLLLDLGYEVDVACNMKQGSPIAEQKVRQFEQDLKAMGVRLYHVPVPRKITKVGDIWKSIVQTKGIINENKYDLIHCHSPIGGMICRVAYRISSHYGEARMLYTAHGFHFYKGAPKKNWLLYYPVEKLCSRWTDVLITMNREDDALAKTRMKAVSACYVPGVGIDLKKITAASVDRREKRKEIGVPEDGILLISVGEVNENKNHEVVIRALSKIKNDSLYYVIAGSGSLQPKLENLAEELGVGHRVKLLGYRADIIELCKSADVFAFPSYREGLSVALMEAMACGLPVVCSRIRGNTDLVENGQGGLLVEPSDIDGFAIAIEQLLGNKQMGERNRQIVRKFSIEHVMELTKRIYANEVKH